MARHQKVRRGPLPSFSGTSANSRKYGGIILATETAFKKRKYLKITNIESKDHIHLTFNAQRGCKFH